MSIAGAGKNREANSLNQVSTLNTLLLILVVFVTSPVSLLLPRMPTAIIVLALVGMAWALQSGTRAATTIDKVAFLFLIFSVANGAVSGLSGNMWREVLNQLMPIPEAYFGFILASRCEWDEARVGKVLRILLINVSLRAAWQLVVTFSGHYIMPPIFGPDEKLNAFTSIGDFTYFRLIDPVCGIFLALSLVLYFYRVEQRLSAVTAFLCGAVSLLGLTRSEWLATASVISLSLWFGRQQRIVRKFVLIGGVAVVGLSVLLTVNPDSLELAEQRFVTHTIEQVTDQGNEYSELRILEIYTSVEKFAEAPLLGHGLGSDLGTFVDTGSGVNFIVLHNYYLNWIATTGLVGLFFFVWLIYRVSNFSVSLVRESTTDFSKALSLCAVGSLLWWGIFMAFMAIYSAYHVTVIIGAAYGVAVALYDRHRRGDSVHLKHVLGERAEIAELPS